MQQDQAAQTLACFGCGGTLLLIPITLLIINIMIMVWAYRDAQSRGENAPLWLLIIFITHFIGLIIYLLVRGEKKTFR